MGNNQFSEIASKILSESGSRTEREKNMARMRQRRSEAARIEIPACDNPQRRERCLEDPPLFLKTYFPGRYTRPFGKLHHALIDSIYEIAVHGGRQAIAAPRGRGKSEITKGMIAYLIFAGIVRFPVPICQTTPKAQAIYSDFRKKINTNEMLLRDFPEVCVPVRDLDGAPLRATKQHIDGKPTNIVWKAKELSLPEVPPEYRGPIDYGGVKMQFQGLDSDIRGINVDGDRPDFVLIDDPETRESAKSLTQIEDREKAIDQDIAGLAGEDRTLAMVMLTTIQNRYCISFRYTNPSDKSAWMGKRFAWVEKWPERMDLWDDYIAKRKLDQEKGDRFAMNAVSHYLENREEMEKGVEVLSDNWKSEQLADGTETVHSAIQEAFNHIADTSMDAFCTEYQNDPPKEEEIETLGLTPARVMTALSGLHQREVASDSGVRVVGIDIGKYHSHWTDTAWRDGAIGDVVDYGVMETHGLSTASDPKAIEIAQLTALEVWAEQVVAEINPQLCLIDSGTFTQTVYEFCRRRGRPFYPAKGWDSGRFRLPKRSKDRVPFLESYASQLAEEAIWLYNVNTEWWKKWLQQRFMTDSFGPDGERNQGSLCLFDSAGDSKRHLSFSHHICSEEEQLVPVHGKEMKRVWFVKNKNNHWLDSTALACAGAGVLGVRVVKEVSRIPEPKPRPTGNGFKFTTPHGQPFVATQRS